VPVGADTPTSRSLRLHKIANVLGALPKSAHRGVKKALAEIWNAEDHRHALDAAAAFEVAYGAKFPKAIATISRCCWRSTTSRRAPAAPAHQTHRGIATSPWPCSPTPTSRSPQRSPQRPDSGLIPLTLGRDPPSPGTPDTQARGQALLWAWSRWRRRHQHRARTGASESGGRTKAFALQDESNTAKMYR
jgi:hypothetical protein